MLEMSMLIKQLVNGENWSLKKSVTDYYIIIALNKIDWNI